MNEQMKAKDWFVMIANQGTLIDRHWVKGILADYASLEDELSERESKAVLIRDDRDWWKDRANEAIKSREEAEELLEEMREYGRHWDNCAWHYGMPDIDTPQRCACGWLNVRTKLYAYFAKYKEMK
jgi:hypothetical protein